MQKCLQGFSALLVFHILIDKVNGNFVAHNLARHANHVMDFMVYGGSSSTPPWCFLGRFGYCLLKVQSYFLKKKNVREPNLYRFQSYFAVQKILRICHF